jgi:FkbM family methyltransferase
MTLKLSIRVFNYDKNMTDFRSNLNKLLRVLASPIKPSNPIRQMASRVWTRILDQTGSGVEVPVAGMHIVMSNQYRQLGADYEADTLKLWVKLLQPGSTVWDVGANIGIYSIISSKLVGAEGEVQSWEPTPVSSEITRRHVALNQVSDWCHVNQAAVGSDDGSSVKFGLVSDESTDPTNRIGASTGKMIEVPMVSLDGELGRRKRRPDFAKIDIEGAEILAIRGAKALMTEADARPVILLAVHPMFLPEFGSDAQELACMVSQRGYTAFNTDGKVAQTLEYNEYLLVPSEKIEITKKKLGWS